MPVYLGLDSSTQSLSAVAIEVPSGPAAQAAQRRVAGECSINFDAELPAYATRNGVLPDADPRVAHSPPLMWAEALDLVFRRLREQGLDPGRVRAVSGSGQQHGSVYVLPRFAKMLASLDAGQPLAGQIRDGFSRPTSPIWMDSSTSEECEELTRSIGGAAEVAQLTGSRAFERFTGPQIRKFYKEDPQSFSQTDKIHLVSSFMATLLAGKHAPIDRGDGSGMNLMDLRRGSWALTAVAATAPGLKNKLPALADSWSIIGPVAPFWAARHGLPADALAVAWSGDNPCSLIGVGLVQPGLLAISLGTSDTLFGFMPEARVDAGGEGHVFGAPTGDFMSLICFKNGSLAREKVRDRLGLDWPGFNQALQAAPPGNRGRVLLPWFDPEITPAVLQAGPRLFGLTWQDGPALVRAVVEGQMASMALHSRWMGVAPKTIYATGGASANSDLLQVMADVFNAEVYPFQVGKSAALGAALRAWHADLKSRGENPAWEDIVRGFAEPSRSQVVRPASGRRDIYSRFLERYRACEQLALRACEPLTLQGGATASDESNPIDLWD